MNGPEQSNLLDLIFGSIGKGLGVVTEGLFSAVVMMLTVTTLAVPHC